MAKLKRKDFRKELETAAKQMILVHRMDTLIRLVLRTIVRTLNVEHAGFLLYDKTRDEYVAKLSRGTGGLKMPSGFVKVKKDSSLIRYFTDPKLRILGDDFLLMEKGKAYIKTKKAAKNKEVKALLEGVIFQLSLYNAQACVPGFFRDKLICVLFLGDKKDKKKLDAEEIGFLSVLSSDVVMAIQNAWFFQDLSEQLIRNKNLFLQTVMALVTAIEAKDKYTSGHTERVSDYSLIVAEEIKLVKKMSSRDWTDFLENLKIASLLHDVGKIGVDERVLNKNGVLDEDERRQIEKHPAVGAGILAKIDEFQEPLLGVKYHHERYDGDGYPDNLKGNKIPLVAQIIAVADTFDAMTTDRPYRKGLTREAAAKVVWENRSKQFSPLIVDAFLRAYKKGKF